MLDREGFFFGCVPRSNFLPSLSMLDIVNMSSKTILDAFDDIVWGGGVSGQSMEGRMNFSKRKQ